MTKKSLVYIDSKGKVTDVAIKEGYITIFDGADRVAKLPVITIWDALVDYLSDQNYKPHSYGLQSRKGQAKNAKLHKKVQQGKTKLHKT